ncbi:diguanylate cyclase [Acidobacteriia bacterium AH_259_A11_L15]|nr:diguanylate cyclase [Acidobacteriia bacterium AH_259_A11_L15]
MKTCILILDADTLLLQLLEKALGKAGHQVTGVGDPVQGLRLLDEQSFDLVITDINLPRLGGIKVLEMVKALDESIEVIILAAPEEERFENALAALRLGASDFLLKPLRNLDELMVSVERALEKRSLAMSIRQLSQNLERMRSTDFLTRVCTRRYFFERMSVELLRSKRYLKAISCLMVDIDHLGQINQAHGTPCGDQVLAHVARILTESTRTSDIVGRYGGEEFIVALIETKPDQAQTAAENVRKVVESRAFTFGGQQIPVTVSIGVAGSEEAVSIAEIVAQAAQALAEAKRAGRNCVRTAQARVSG